jgi:hypothetical protein
MLIPPIVVNPAVSGPLQKEILIGQIPCYALLLVAKNRLVKGCITADLVRQRRVGIDDRA